jgi:predicted Holliday junction resolvase-like endonuclease
MRAEGWLYRVAVGLSAVTLILVVVYIVLVQDNRSVQREVNQRQQFINQSVQLSRVNEALIRALADGAVKGKSDKLRDLLAQNRISINAAGDPIPSASGPAENTTAPAPARAQ